ncbi:MAG: radical SAM protein [Anaerolineae bacterium]
MLVNSSGVAILARILNGNNLTPDELSSPFVETLYEAGLLGHPGEEGSTDLVRFQEQEVTDYKPTELTLFLTTDCYQRCRYCYAEGGRRSKTMSFEIAKAAIDFVVQNTLGLGEDRFSVGFHGGGEPTYHWDLLVRCTRYAQKLAKRHHLRLQLSTATSGVLLPSRARWLAENMSGGSSISLDGPPEFQNPQRPIRGGRESFDAVYHTLKLWDSMCFSYGIRATITEESVSHMADIVSFVAAEFKTDKLHFEPLFACGRCRTSKMSAPDPEEFAKHYIEAQERAEEVGINLVYSGARTDELTDSYCGGGRARYLWVTHDGHVTACFEVLEREDPRSDIFFIGRYDPESKSFLFDLERLAPLQKRRVQNLSCCADCIAKWHCAGDCMAKSALAGDLFNPTLLGRCIINQKLTLNYVMSLLAKEDADYDRKTKAQLQTCVG